MIFITAAHTNILLWKIAFLLRLMFLSVKANQWRVA